MTQKSGAVHLRPQTHLLLDKLAQITGQTKTQILDDAVRTVRTNCRQNPQLPPHSHYRRDGVLWCEGYGPEFENEKPKREKSV